MKSKAFHLLLCAIVGISMISGCGGQSTSTNTGSESNASSDTADGSNESISVDKNILSVEITIPASMYGEEGANEESLEIDKDAYPDLEYTINDDGSVTYKMSKSTHQKFLDELKASLDEGFQELTDQESDSYVASFTEISYNDDLSVFNVIVDPEAYTSWDTLYALSLEIAGMYYQAFTGVDSDDLFVEVNFINETTNEIIDTINTDSLQEASESLSGSETTSNELMENISFHEYGFETGVVSTFENNNDEDVTIHGNITYYDSSGNMLSSETAILWDCAKNGTGSLAFQGPLDADYNYVAFDSFDVSYTVEDASTNFSVENLQNQIDVKSNPGSDGGVTAMLTNNTGNTLDEIDLMCVYFSGSEAVGYTSEFIWTCGETASVSFAPPMNANWEAVSYDNYEIFINSTIIYSE